MRCLLPALLLLVLAVPGWAKEPDEEIEFQKHLDETYEAEFKERVNAAIKRGVAHLLARQRKDGAWDSVHNKGYPMGPSALAVLTLHKSGFERDHPRMKQAWAYIYKQALTKTYSVAVLMMALDAKYAPARDPFEVVDTDRYGFTKSKKGGDPCALTISKQDKALMRAGVKFLIKNQQADGSWRYPSGGTDLSNTQYALLGLHAANRCGIKVPHSVWLAALRFLHERQEKQGKVVELRGNEIRGRYRLTWTEGAMARGFRYVAKAKHVTGSMTTAGLAGLVICQNALWKSRKFDGKLRAKTRRGIRDALAWMQENYDVTTNPTSADDEDKQAKRAWFRPHVHHYYYLYGLERAGVLTRTRFFDENDWYEDGAEFLLHEQLEDGGWPADPMRHKHTCFAILFLKRATSRMRAPAITPSVPDPAKSGKDAKSGK